MDKIVKSGLKIDLHIHSCASGIKDGKKVKHNTVQNLPILIRKLNAEGVNICAVTDHDVFSYEIYSGLKIAETQTGSIQKVLPGVEFSVCFENDDSEKKVIHVVTIFSDEDNSKIQNIESVLQSIRPDVQGAYSEECFLKILRIIDLDTILIAHQKNSLSSTKPRKNDANSLGDKKFHEFVYSDYFEAFEFKNRRNEVLNKNYLLQANLEKQVRFVTGTDCHDWNVYPREDSSDKLTNFPYTFVKCLPTFRGLVMAVTDSSRLKTVDSFFNAEKFSLDCITLHTKGKQITIPLSKGINVIIGDNSIGKSLLLHAIVDFEKSGDKLPAHIKKGYKKCMDKHKLQISKQISPENVFYFDMQGEVRAKFEENHLNATEFLSRYFPPNINPQPYKSLVVNEIDRMINYLSEKFSIDSEIRKLQPFKISISDGPPESLVFINNLRSHKKDMKSITDILSKISELILLIEQLAQLPVDEEDRVYLEEQLNFIREIQKKYQVRVEGIQAENERIEIIAKTIIKISTQHNRNISDNHKKETSFLSNTTEIKETLINILAKQRKLQKYLPHIEETAIVPVSNTVFDYQFISRLNVDKLDTEYFMSHIRKALRSNKEIDWDTINESYLKEIILKYDGSKPVLQFFKETLLASIEEDFTPKNVIIYQGMDKSEELSSGLNAKIYFDLLSYENTRDGIYIIDQPEDNISQSAIKTYLLDRFKTMGENRQILMVTHNPQFIVNLDIDNLIYIFRTGDTLNVYSGALEYADDTYNILDIVAKNIDGGLDSIQKRWKRYEKVANI